MAPGVVADEELDEDEADEEVAAAASGDAIFFECPGRDPIRLAAFSSSPVLPWAVTPPVKEEGEVASELSFP